MASSFEAGKIGRAPEIEEGQEFNAYTLFGADQPIYTTLLRWIETEDGEQVDDRELLRRLQAHIDRGLGAISVRVKNQAMQPDCSVDILLRNDGPDLLGSQCIDAPSRCR